MSTAGQIKMEPLSKFSGVKILGVDLRNTIDGSLAEVLREALAYYSILYFPGQDIEAEHQADFAALFGKVDRSLIRSGENPDQKQSSRGVMYVSNMKENGRNIGVLPDGEMHFHSDGSHRNSPYRATSLYAIKVPSKGGETLFASMTAAYEALDDGTKVRLEGMTAKHIFNYNKTKREDIPEKAEASAEHPLILVHPQTKRKSLYLSRLMTVKINGMAISASNELLLSLFDHCEKPEFIYTHEWTPRDLVIWDNRSVNHARRDFPSEEDRLLRRYTVSEPDTDDHGSY